MSDKDNSVFTPAVDKPAETPVTETPAQDNNPVYEWIGEGKKYKTEQEALASVPAAQTHISKIEQENLELRKQLEELKTNSKSMDTVLDALQQREQPQAAPVTAGGIDEGILIEKINQVVDSRTQAEREQGNLAEADRLARQYFGEKAQEEIQNKASEIGLSLDYLAEVAKRSPNAFAKLVGISEGNQAEQPRGVASTGSVVNTQSLQSNSQVKNMAYYNQLRRENPKLYKTLEIQQEMMRNRTQLGAKFFSN